MRAARELLRLVGSVVFTELGRPCSMSLDTGPAAMDYTICVCVHKCTVNAEKCDLLTPTMRVEAATLAERDKMVQNSVTKCNKVWNCVTI